MKNPFPIAPPARGDRIELVAGPSCGRVIPWPPGAGLVIVVTEGSRPNVRAEYQYEGAGKAVCIRHL